MCHPQVYTGNKVEERQLIAAAVVFGHAREATGLVDRMKIIKEHWHSGLRMWTGQVGELVLPVVAANGCPDQIHRATQAILQSHRPALILVGGFAVALRADVKPETVLMCEEVIRPNTTSVRFSIPGWLEELLREKQVVAARSTSLDQSEITPQTKRTLARRTNADICDAVVWHVLEACRTEQATMVPLLAVRESFDEESHPALRSAYKQQHWAASLGAILRGVWDNPRTLSKWYGRLERHLICADKLGKVFLDILLAVSRTIGQDEQQ